MTLTLTFASYIAFQYERASISMKTFHIVMDSRIFKKVEKSYVY